MSSALVGMTVTRTIPDATLAGLALDRYTLHGGVIRWAAGTRHAGQIVDGAPDHVVCTVTEDSRVLKLDSYGFEEE